MLDNLEKIKLASKGDLESLAWLDDNYGAIISKVSATLIGQKRFLLQEYLDMKRDKTLILWQCAVSFDSEKGCRFSTWVYNQIRWKCLTLLKKSIREHARRKFFNEDFSDKGSLLEKLYSLNEEGSFKKDGRVSQNFNMQERLKDVEDREELQLIKSTLDSHKKDRSHKVFCLRMMNEKFLTWREIAEEVGCCKQQAINLFNKKLKEIKRDLKKHIPATNN